MWPFKSRECTCADRVARLESVVKRLVDDVDELEQRYTSLRGLVYAKKLHKKPEDDGLEPPAVETDTSKMNKAELKAYLTRSGRFVPGKPPTHNQE